MQLLIIFNVLPDVLDGKLVPAVLDVLQLNFAGFKALLLVLNDLLKKAQPAILWPRQPNVHLNFN